MNPRCLANSTISIRSFSPASLSRLTTEPISRWVMLELGSRLARYETATFGATASKELGGHASAVLFDSLGVVDLDCGVGETA